MDKELDMLDVVKNMRYMKVLMNGTYLRNEKNKYLLQHTFQSVLDVDEYGEGSKANLNH